MNPIIDRTARPLTRRRRGRPTAEEVAARLPPAPARVDPATARLLCPTCGRPDLVANGAPRKSDGAVPLRCKHCGTPYVKSILLAPVSPPRVES